MVCRSPDRHNFDESYSAKRLGCQSGHHQLGIHWPSRRRRMGRKGKCVRVREKQSENHVHRWRLGQHPARISVANGYLQNHGWRRALDGSEQRPRQSRRYDFIGSQWFMVGSEEPLCRIGIHGIRWNVQVRRCWEIMEERRSRGIHPLPISGKNSVCCESQGSAGIHRRWHYLECVAFAKRRRHHGCEREGFNVCWNHERRCLSPHEFYLDESGSSRIRPHP
jgi:hypothetical protein